MVLFFSSYKGIERPLIAYEAGKYIFTSCGELLLVAKGQLVVEKGVFTFMGVLGEFLKGCFGREALDGTLLYSRFGVCKCMLLSIVSSSSSSSSTYPGADLYGWR